jgi:hypothetical protein
MKQFMQEAYGNGFSRQHPEKNVLQTDDQKRWAIRNNNNTNRDALNVAKKAHTLTNSEFLLQKGYLDQTESWETLLKLEGTDAGLEELLSLSTKEIGCGSDARTKRALLRFYLRIKKFLRYVRKDKKNARV